MRSTSPPVNVNPTLSYASELPRYGTPNEKIEFQLLRLHHTTQPYSLIHIAETVDRTVNFARRYSIGLHAFCAICTCTKNSRLQRTPRRLVCCCYGLHFSIDTPSESPNYPRLLHKWKYDLRNLMRAFHENDLIHGDLREPNFLCIGEAVMPVDLDWVGKIGGACYPSAQLRRELTIGRDSSDPKITKDDDRRILENTLRML